MLYLKGGLSKIRSVHTYVIPRTVVFGWICTVHHDLRQLDLIWNSGHGGCCGWAAQLPIITWRNLVWSPWKLPPPGKDTTVNYGISVGLTLVSLESQILQMALHNKRRIHFADRMLKEKPLLEICFLRW